MKEVLRLILFIPASIIGYYLFLMIIGFISVLIKGDNFIMEEYIVPIIVNIIGIFVYFSIGKFLMPKFEKSVNRKIAYFLLTFTLISISVYFLYFSFIGKEYYKAIINTLNILLLIGLFIGLSDEN